MEFVAWPKIPRLNKDGMIITEKIDGTNGCIVIEKVPFGTAAANGFGVWGLAPNVLDVVLSEGLDDAGMPDAEYWIGAQSRNRMLTLEQDNAGFARWASENVHGLVSALGEGRHYGEWWGQGIQRGYGLDHKRFSLFNTARWANPDQAERLTTVENLGAVPVLYQGKFSTLMVQDVLDVLAFNGSTAAPGYSNPEGVVVYHKASRSMYKAFVENDDRPKGLC